MKKSGKIVNTPEKPAQQEPRYAIDIQSHFLYLQLIQKAKEFSKKYESFLSLKIPDHGKQG
jgi:hypothetical protein